MNAGFGFWLYGVSLGASALGGMRGMASGIFIVLAATTFGSALLCAINSIPAPASAHRPPRTARDRGRIGTPTRQAPTVGKLAADLAGDLQCERSLTDSSRPVRVTTR